MTSCSSRLCSLSSACSLSATLSSAERGRKPLSSPSIQPKTHQETQRVGKGKSLAWTPLGSIGLRPRPGSALTSTTIQTRSEGFSGRAVAMAMGASLRWEDSSQGISVQPSRQLVTSTRKFVSFTSVSSTTRVPTRASRGSRSRRQELISIVQKEGSEGRGHLSESGHSLERQSSRFNLFVRRSSPLLGQLPGL
jgi:hypothetical protein